MKNIKIIFPLLLLIIVISSCSEKFYSSEHLDKNILVSAKIDRDTFLITDSMKFYFIVENHLNEEIYLYIKSDVHNNWWINGKEIEYISVSVQDDKNNILMKPPRSGMHAGWNESFKKLMPHEKYITEFSLDEWANIKDAGTYKINLSQKLRVSPEEINVLYTSKKEARKSGKKIRYLDKQSAISFIVIES